MSAEIYYIMNYNGIINQCIAAYTDKQYRLLINI